jgi:hypothetical protein
MTTLKTAMLAAVLIAGGTSLALAQNGPAGDANGNNGMPPSSYLGPGGMPTYSSSQFQGNQGNQGNSTLYDRDGAAAGGDNGNNGMPPSSYQGPGAMPTYK